jgi:XTP/dITP diphosphohydrolase
VTPLYFVSSNHQKHADVTRIFADSARPVRILERRLVEILSDQLVEVVQEKAKAAYRATMVPVIVEHGALYIDYLDHFPGPMVRLFWEKLRDRLPLLIPEGAPRTAHVIQMVCYCDEKRLHVYPGRIDGSIAPTRRGGGGIHWDSMFIPEGHTLTLGEMGAGERIAAHAFFKAYAALRADQHI